MSRLPSLGRRGEGWFALQLVLLAGIVVAGLWLGPDWSGAARLLTVAAGGALLIGGVVLVWLGARRHDTLVSPLPRPVAGARLVEDGIYGRVRHPIYSGVMASALGWSLATASLVALALSIALVVLLDLKARREEVWLAEHYPAYSAYVARTRRFVPGLY
jgi:protein-S-isoprenylcysteine O-methyltransferase Ste14